jgi:hypothetical protein
MPSRWERVNRSGTTMARKRFNAEQVAQHAAEANVEDRISPPTREVSLSDVVRTLWPNIQARRAAGHPFPRIAGWLGTLGYDVSAATLCVYWHRLSKESEHRNITVTEDPRPPPASAIKTAARDTTKPTSACAVMPAAKPVSIEVSPTRTTATRPKGPRDDA